MDVAMLLGGFAAGGALAGAVGGAVGFALGAARARAAAEPALREADGRARAADATVDELRRSAAASRTREESMEVALRRLEAERAAVLARADELERGLDSERQLLADAKSELSTTFQALAADALQRSNEGFLQLATEKLGAAQREGATDLAAREHAIAALLGPLSQTLLKVDEHARVLERERGSAYAALKEQVRFVIEGQDCLRTETNNLVTALRAPATRGRWGEMQLRRVLEIAGMVSYCDFDEQATVNTPDGRLRPDVVVRLPGGRSVVVDAKAPMEAYLDALAATTEAERDDRLRQHALQVRAHIFKLGAKSYWDQFASSPEMVVMFLPGDRLYASALEQMPSLLEEAFASKVLVATPSSLFGILQAVHAGWRQERLAANAEEISRSGRELHERLATFGEHLGKLGSALGRTVEAFNSTVGSYELRVLPGTRRLEDLGATGKKTLPDVEPVDARARPLLPAEPTASERASVGDRASLSERAATTAEA